MKKLLSIIVLLLTGTFVSAQENTVSRVGKLSVGGEMSWGYVIPNFGENSKYYEKGFSMGMEAAIGPRYYAMENLYIEAMAGAKWLYVTSNVKGDNNNTTNSIWDITIPLHLGYHCSPNLQVFAGPRIDIPVSSKIEYKNEKEKYNIPTTVVIEGGLVYKKFQLKFSYSPAEKNKYTMISVGWKVCGEE